MDLGGHSRDCNRDAHILIVVLGDHWGRCDRRSGAFVATDLKAAAMSAELARHLTSRGSGPRGTGIIARGHESKGCYRY